MFELATARSKAQLECLCLGLPERNLPSFNESDKPNSIRPTTRVVDVDSEREAGAVLCESRGG